MSSGGFRQMTRAQLTSRRSNTALQLPAGNASLVVNSKHREVAGGSLARTLGGEMIPGINASPNEEKAIRLAFESWAEHFRRALLQSGLTFLLGSYESLVHSLETGRCSHSDDYASCCGDFYEFTNDLSVRGAIEIVLDSISGTERTRIVAMIAALDERYRRTQVGAEFFLGSGARARYPEPKYWWYYGLPRGVHR